MGYPFAVREMKVPSFILLLLFFFHDEINKIHAKISLSHQRMFKENYCDVGTTSFY